MSGYARACRAVAHGLSVAKPTCRRRWARQGRFACCLSRVLGPFSIIDRPPTTSHHLHPPTDRPPVSLSSPLYSVHIVDDLFLAIRPPSTAAARRRNKLTRRARRVVLLSLHSFQGRQFAACTPTHALANAHVAARSSLSHRLRARTNPPDRHRISLRRPSQIDLARQRHFFTQPAILNQTRRPHQESTQSNRKPSIIQPLQQVSTSSHRIQTDNAFPINDDVNNGV
jgi:hypothetical protein